MKDETMRLKIVLFILDFIINNNSKALQSIDDQDLLTDCGPHFYLSADMVKNHLTSLRVTSGGSRSNPQQPFVGFLYRNCRC